MNRVTREKDRLKVEIMSSDSRGTGEKGKEGCGSNSPGSHGGSPPPQKVDIDVRHVILVLSGKGGVGKSTIAVNLAYAFSSRGHTTGLLDLDIHGPNIAKMLGAEEAVLASDGKKMQPVTITGNLKAISMAFLLPDTSSPVIWRGPVKMVAIRQFLEEVDWGALDVLIVDLPPGTGDEALSIAQLAPNILGAVIVTTPQDVATLDAAKALSFVRQSGIPVLGIVENMAGMVCPHCGKEIDLFGSGGGKKLSEHEKVPFLGSIPLNPKIADSGDTGRPFLYSDHGSEAAKAMERVMDTLVDLAPR